MTKQKEPTWTSLVVAALRLSDDFMDVPMLVAATRGSADQVRAALYHLRKHRVVGMEINADGHPWYYLRPQEEDDRSRLVLERTPETAPRKQRHKSRARQAAEAATRG